MESEDLSLLQHRELIMWEEFLVLGGDPSVATTSIVDDGEP